MNREKLEKIQEAQWKLSNTYNVILEKMYDDVVTPEYKNEDDSGMDIRAYFTDEWIQKQHSSESEDRVWINENLDWIDKKEKAISIRPQGTILIPTGIKVALPPFTEIQVRPRSGMSLKYQLIPLNSPGTVDACYRGEIGIILHNAGNKPRDFAHGERISQIVLCPVLKINWEEGKVDETERGAGGFGSTGTK